MSTRAKRSLFAASAAVVAVALVAAYVFATAGPATAKPFATLDILQGDAEVKLEGAEAFLPARDGATLRRGDTVRTGERGRAEIEYFDGSVTRLDVETTFGLTELVSTPQEVRVVGEHASGSTFSRVVELTGSQSRFEVETPSAVASVRGTTFFTQVEAGASELVGVLGGEVLVTGASGPTKVLVGEGVTVSSAGDVSAPFVLTAAHLDSDWLFYNLCVLDHVQEVCSVVQPNVPEAAERTPRPVVPVVADEGAPQPPSSPKPQENDGPPAPQVEQEEAPPPSPPPPPPPPGLPPPPVPPPPEPPSPPGGPPCDNPGQGTPCDGPGSAGSPPGHGKG
jgi:hypothetical protein